MKSLFAILLLTSASILSAGDIAASAQKQLVGFVDSIRVPIPASSLAGSKPISDGSDESGLKISKTFIAGEQAFRDGLEASLIGPPERPLAVVFWVQSAICYYYVPFPEVRGIDRPRRLSKLGDRVYRIESNRSSKGNRVQKLLP